MKYLKISLIAFAITLLLAAAGISAAPSYQTYVGLSIPALKKVLVKGPQIKTETGLQFYDNTGTINSCTGNENGIMAAVKSEAGGQSSWLILKSAGQSGAWANDNKSNVKRAYNLLLRNYTGSPCQAKHSGSWYLDKSAYNLIH